MRVLVGFIRAWEMKCDEITAGDWLRKSHSNRVMVKAEMFGLTLAMFRGFEMLWSVDYDHSYDLYNYGASVDSICTSF